MPSSASAAGRIAIPDHELIRRIGTGSYGEVWLARNVMGTYRAVKIVQRNNFQSDRPYAREFAGIQKFEPFSRSQENQVNILHIGREEDCFFYVMELADDQATGPVLDPQHYTPRTLKSELDKRGRLPFETCLEIALSLTAALAHLHKHGLIHRDVKPSNVIYVNGITKLADIGLVTDSDATMSFVGTEGFIPPEGPGTPQGDIYSLGKLLYELSTGKNRQDYPEPPTLLGEFLDREQILELGEIIKKACASKPGDRYPSAQAMQTDLLLLKTGKSVRRTHQLERRLKRTRQFTAAIIAVMLLGVVPYYVAIKESRMALATAKREAEQHKMADREAANARRQLWLACLAQAQASRFSGLPGNRSKALKALEQAAAIRPSPELRNETIACLAMTDVSDTNVLAFEPTDGFFPVLDSTYERIAIYCASRDTISIRSVKDGTERLRLNVPQTPVSNMNNDWLKFSRDGRLLAIAQRSQPPNFYIWDLKENEATASFPGRDCRTVDFSRDGRLAAISFHHGNDTNHPIIIYDLATQQTINTLEHGTLPYIITFNPVKNELATSSQESSNVLIWDAISGQKLAQFHHPDVLGEIDWNPDGQLLACGCADNQIYLWDVASGAPTHVLAGHSGFPAHISFSNDGIYLASLGYDGTLRFWDPWLGQQLF